jgi:hypothetical protein
MKGKISILANFNSDTNNDITEWFWLFSFDQKKNFVIV